MVSFLRYGYRSMKGHLHFFVMYHFSFGTEKKDTKELPLRIFTHDLLATNI